MEQYIRRCFQLARLGAGHVLPNPLVGAVVVHADRIIGEGWHRRYGEAHAEVNALRAVAEANRHLIPQSTLFCNLEPCFHFGKTPPCVDLILKEKIPRVVVANTDPNPLVAGQSIQKLRAAGVEVHAGILEADGRYLNRAFFTWIEKKRPHIILKWAQSADGYLGRQGERMDLTCLLAQRLVHRMRAEADAILVGTTTALWTTPASITGCISGNRPCALPSILPEKFRPRHTCSRQLAHLDHWPRTQRNIPENTVSRPNRNLRLDSLAPRKSGAGKIRRPARGRRRE